MSSVIAPSLVETVGQNKLFCGKEFVIRQVQDVLRARVCLAAKTMSARRHRNGKRKKGKQEHASDWTKIDQSKTKALVRDFQSVDKNCQRSNAC